MAHDDVARISAAFFGLLFAFACGGSSDEPRPARAGDAGSQPPAIQETTPSSTKPPKGPRGPIDPTQTGTIAGVVRFDGPAPERKPLSIGSTGGCPEHEVPVLDESAQVDDGRLANVFVWIKDGLEGWEIPAPPDAGPTMDQKGCLYAPHVLGMRVGQKLRVQNSDPTTHNVNIRSRSNDALNPIQPPGGQPIEWRPSKRELGVSFECNLHPWMRAWVCAVDHPWFAVTAKDGAYRMDGVPPGEYVLEAWHEKFGKKTVKVALAPGGSADTAITYAPADRSR